MRERGSRGPLQGPVEKQVQRGALVRPSPSLRSVFLDGSDILETRGRVLWALERGPASQHQGDMTEFTFLVWLP